jgi:rhomboid family GlyGly-CTERM serine protease
MAWLTVATAGLAGALLAWWLPAVTLDWQPALARTEPWRALTAAWVHWSPQHLAANAAGAAVVAALGWVARLPARAALAWLLAWPLTQIGLLLQPELAHYGGLSGVLHAGVAVAAVFLLRSGGSRRQRWVGAGLALGLLTKLLLEAPWGPALRPSAEMNMAVAPLAHASGALAGAVCALVLGIRKRGCGW